MTTDLRGLQPQHPTLYQLAPDGESLEFLYAQCPACRKLVFPANVPGCSHCGECLLLLRDVGRDAVCECGASCRIAMNDGASLQLPHLARAVPVYAAASGPGALTTAGAVADGAFVNYGLQAEHVRRARTMIAGGAREAERSPDDLDVWWIACLDVAPRREDALEKLGNILGFVGAYVVGPAPERRDVPPELIPAVRELRRTYTTRRSEMDPALTKRLGIFDYLRRRLAIAGTPDECVEQVRAAIAAGATRLMFTVSLASDPVRTVELFGKEVLPQIPR